MDGTASNATAADHSAELQAEIATLQADLDSLEQELREAEAAGTDDATIISLRNAITANHQRIVHEEQKQRANAGTEQPHEHTRSMHARGRARAVDAALLCDHCCVCVGQSKRGLLCRAPCCGLRPPPCPRGSAVC